MAYHLWIPATLLATVGSAQGFVVSPPGAATREGDTSLVIPWTGGNATGRYQQVHDGLRGSARTIQGLAFRRDGSPSAGRPAIRVDLELRMADSDLARFDRTYRSNYRNPPVVVLPRRVVAMPDTQQVGGQPAPFTITLPFQQQFAYAGTHDLLWEVRKFQAPTHISYFTDAQAVYGARSLAKNLTRSCETYLHHHAHIATYGHTRTAAFRASVQHFNSPSTLFGVALGVARARFQIGICFVEVAPLTVLVGRARSQGATVRYDTPPIVVPWTPALQNFKVYSQGFDAVRPVTTNAVETTVPALGGRTDMARYLFGSLTATQGYTLQAPGGLVVRFQHR